MSAGKGIGRSGWASSDDYTFLSLAVIVVGLAFGGWMLWSHHHTEVVEAVAALQLCKMSALSLVTDEPRGLSRMVAAARYETVTFDELVAMSGRVNTVIRIPAAALIGALAVLCFVWAPPARFRRRFDLDGLAREQARFFRAAGAYLGRGLRLVPLGTGSPRPADPALHPHEWLLRLPVEQEEVEAAPGPSTPAQQAAPEAEQAGSVAEAKPKRKWRKLQEASSEYDADRVRKGLIAQLGPVWRGATAARPQSRVMFAAFALHLAGRREESLLLLGDFAEALASDTGHGPAGPEALLPVPPSVLAAADALIGDGTVGRPAEAITRHHAFETTALMGLLNAARLNGGVLAPAQFNGLKLVDRGLWYALHSLGFPGHGPGQNAHPNPRVEAIGARAHWDAERQARCPLFEPEVDSALRAVRAAIKQHREEQKEQP
ncbi:secretion/conjugation apparatus DotM-related subunit [Roseomonas mucosa]